MMRWERGRVREQLGGWPGVSLSRVEVGEEVLRALSYTELTGTPEVGETVLLNTNALRRGLGTGGDALVVARPDVADPSPVPADPGSEAAHMMKLRYTPMQTMVDAIDDPASEHYATMTAAQDLEGMPVVVADLHSALPAIVGGILADAPQARIAYVLTDGAALPAPYSRTLTALRLAGLVSASISAGQAFGGDLEAVSIPSALLGARHVADADVAIAIQGSGNLGTGTRWGFSGVQAADAANAVGALGGRPIGALRVSEADARARHRGLSHHSATAYGPLLHVPCTFAVLTDNRFQLSVNEQLQDAVIDPAARRGIEHRVLEVPSTGLRHALKSLPVHLSTMGRGLAEDPEAFLAAAAAGRAAAAMLNS